MTVAWSLVITKRDGTAVGTISAADVISTAHPVAAFRGKDSVNDIAAAELTIPAEHALNDWMVEDYLAHLYSRAAYVTTYIVRTPQVGIIDQGEEAREFAVYHLDHCSSVLAEGIVEPAGAIGTEPQSADVIFDSSHPDRDNSDFTTPDALGSVTDAQTNYPVTPYGVGAAGTAFLYPGTVQVIGPAGYGWGDDAPGGRCYFYKDHDFGAGGLYTVNAVGDNAFEVRLNGMTIIPYGIGFGTARSWSKRLISGVQRIWGVVENGGSGALSEGPCTFALEVAEVDMADNVLGLETYTDTSWGIAEFPATPPGWTVGGIGLNCVADEQAAAQPSLVDVVCSFDAVNDSHGDPWPDTWDIGTKATSGLEVFWLKELAEKYADFDAHYNFGTGKITIDAWVKGHRSGTLTLTEGTNLASLTLPTSPALATSFVSQWNNGGNLSWTESSVTPVTGHPAKRRGLSQGAARSTEQVGREASKQLLSFGRARTKPTFTMTVTSATADAALPPNWWKWATATVSTSSRWVTNGDYDVIGVTFELDGNGNLVFTPEVGDRIIPAEVRSNLMLRKLAGNSLGGQSRIATPATPVPPSSTTTYIL